LSSKLGLHLPFARIAGNGIHRDRLADVLELPFAPILETNVQLALDFVMDFPGDQNAAWIGQSFKPGGDIDAFPINVAVLIDHDIAEVDPNAQLQRAIVGCEVVLNFDRAL
jgi:hypothetical protein